MNILFHCSEYPPERCGGIGSVTRIVAEGLASRGHVVVVSGYYPSFQKSERESYINGVHVFRYSLGTQYGRIKSHLYHYRNFLHMDLGTTQNELDYYEAKLQELIHRFQIQVLELTDYYEFNYCNKSLSFTKFAIPTVLRAHGSASFLNKYFRKVNKNVLLNDFHHFSRTDYLLSVSGFAQDYINSVRPVDTFKSYAVIYNCVEDKILCEEKDIMDNNTKTILFLGKLTEAKGAFQTVRAFNIFHKTHGDWKLKLVGPGNIKKIRKIVSAEARQDVLFCGPCDRTCVIDHLNRCSFVCAPSFFESFSMVPLEAMARGKTVVISERTSGPEVVENSVEGFLINPSDCKAISDSMSMLADNPDLRALCSYRAYQKARNCFSQKVVLDKLEKIYLDISNLACCDF